MTFQISNLIAMVMRSAAPAIAITLIWAQDMYIDASARVYKIFMYVLSWLVYTHARMQSHTDGVNIVCAHAYANACEPDRIQSDSRDITLAVKLFYMFDSVLSCASMYRWMCKLGLECNRVRVVFRRDQSIYAVVLDIENDVELQTGMPVSDVDLSKFCGVLLRTRDEVISGEKKSIASLNTSSEDSYYNRMCERDD